MSHTGAIFAKYQSVQFGEEGQRVSVLVPEPDRLPEFPFLGEEALIQKCVDAWIARRHFRIEGPPGVGKNALVYELGRRLAKPVFILRGHGDMEPQDLVCSARFSDSPDNRYVASPLVAAMIYPGGGICFCDEIGKLPARALSVLTSILDDQQTIESIVAVFRVQPDPGFRFCAALNPLERLPVSVESRLEPHFPMGYPAPRDLVAIVRARCADAHALLLDAFRDWVAEQTDVAPRAAIQLMTFAEAMALTRPVKSARQADELIECAAAHTLVS